MLKRGAVRNNKEVYSTVEFHRWIGRDRLDPDEQYLVRRFLNPTAKTLEAGTGGGRILFALHQAGFTDLHGFDYVPGFIEQAKRADTAHAINFEVQDATRLTHANNSFDQVIYLQQILSCLDAEDAPVKAAREAFRILRPGGTALFSFLSFEVRSRSVVYGTMIRYLRLLRWLRRSRRSMRDLPWLRMGDRFNWGALIDRGPYVHWFGAEEAQGILQGAGFSIEGVATSRQLAEDVVCRSAAELLTHPLGGALCFVCGKPRPSPQP